MLIRWFYAKKYEFEHMTHDFSGPPPFRRALPHSSPTWRY